jgi:hypothetical protein
VKTALHFLVSGYGDSQSIERLNYLEVRIYPPDLFVKIDFVPFRVQVREFDRSRLGATNEMNRFDEL